MKKPNPTKRQREAAKSILTFIPSLTKSAKVLNMDPAKRKQKLDELFTRLRNTFV